MKNWIASGLAITVGATIGFAANYALAGRNASGTMSAANGPYVSGQVISSSLVNARLADIETEITDSLSRSGKGGMTAPLRTADGSAAAPSWSWTSDTDSGLYRVGADNIGIALGGTKYVDLTTTSMQLALANLDRTTAAALNIGTTNATTITVGRSGQNTLFSGLVGIGSTPRNAVNPLEVEGAGFLMSMTSRSGVNAYIGSNTYFTSGTNDTYDEDGFAGVLQMPSQTGEFVFYTAPSGTAGGTATLTERMKVTTTGVTIGSGGQAYGAIKRTSFAKDWGATGAGGCSGGQLVNVTNIAFGDACWVAHSSADLGSAWLTCRVNSAGQVTVDLCAFTDTNPASATYYIHSLQATN